MQGSEKHSIAAQSQQRLSIEQENHLSQWILSQESLVVSLTHSQIKEFVQRLLILKGDLNLLSKRWIQAFIRRNPILKTKRTGNVDSAQVNSATTQIIRAWFQYLVLPKVLVIKPENRYNMDEAGIMEGLGVNGLAVGSSQVKGIQKKINLVLRLGPHLLSVSLLLE
jgi:4-hydroxybenzoate polyprenyltransferase